MFRSRFWKLSEVCVDWPRLCGTEFKTRNTYCYNDFLVIVNIYVFSFFFVVCYRVSHSALQRHDDHSTARGQDAAEAEQWTRDKWLHSLHVHAGGSRWDSVKHVDPCLVLVQQKGRRIQYVLLIVWSSTVDSYDVLLFWHRSWQNHGEEEEEGRSAKELGLWS